ncbi:MAG: aminopeptidase P family protein [Planctomycetes bacterium]|nr:aminopeptidase P family protein [Planctomycetota bacterium]
MDRKIINARLRAVRCELEDERLDGIIVTKAVNVSYVTGFCGDDSWAVITARKVYLLTDSRYIEQTRKECYDCQIIERREAMGKAVGGLLGKLKSVKTIGIEDSTSIALLRGLRKNLDAKIKPTSNLVESVRKCKDAGEIKSLKGAIEIAAKAFKKTRGNVRSGMTENELAGRLDFEIRKLGAENSFETIVAFGVNASRPHHKPGSKKLRKNDNVLIDFGVRYKGYCSDLTRCFSVGKISGLYKKVFKAVEESQAAAIGIIRAGVKISEVDAAARAVIEKYGLGVYGHGTGHGLGLEVHEGPVVSGKVKGELQAGEIITIEPGVYMQGKLGVRIEDDVLVTERGCKILSSGCPH